MKTWFALLVAVVTSVALPIAAQAGPAPSVSVSLVCDRAAGWANVLDMAHPSASDIAIAGCVTVSYWYDAKFYAEPGSESPRHLVASKRRASRGGSWRHRGKTTRINARSSLDPTFRYSDFGFRVYAGL